MDLLENCSLLYSYKLTEFPTAIVIQGNLAPTTGYYIKVTDKFGNAFLTGPVITNTYGTLNISVPISFPTGWFNRNAGKFKIEASITSQPFNPVNFTFNSVQYPGIEAEFVEDNTPVNIVQ